MQLYSYAVVRLYSCACTITYPCAVMPLCSCACTIAHTYACVLSCLHYLVQLFNHALVRLYARALMRLCKDWQGRQGSEEIPAVPAYMMVMPNRTLPTCFPCRTCQEPREAERPARHG